MPDGFTYELFLDGKPVAPPEDVVSTMESIIQDHGEIPPEYLVAAGPGLYKRGLGGESKDADSPSGPGPTTRRAPSSTTSGTTAASTTARAGASCASTRSSRPVWPSTTGRCASTADSSSPCGAPSRCCAARTAS